MLRFSNNLIATVKRFPRRAIFWYLERRNNRWLLNLATMVVKKANRILTNGILPCRWPKYARCGKRMFSFPNFNIILLFWLVVNIILPIIRFTLSKVMTWIMPRSSQNTEVKTESSCRIIFKSRFTPENPLFGFFLVTWFNEQIET